MKVKTKEDIRRRIKNRIRKKIAGTPARPRLAVFRSQTHIYAQVIDDEAGRTLCSASSLDVDTVVFDRGGFHYHGRIKALADAAREGGLKF